MGVNSTSLWPPTLGLYGPKSKQSSLTQTEKENKKKKKRYVERKKIKKSIKHTSHKVREFSSVTRILGACSVGR